MTLDEVIDKAIGREKFEAYCAQEDERVAQLTRRHADPRVVSEFMEGAFDGCCPKCGNHADAIESDEGLVSLGNEHWFERYWECTSCGCQFTERYEMVPKAIWITEVTRWSR